MEEPRTVIIFDYNLSGHIPAFHRLFVAAALLAGHRVVSLSGNPGAVERYVRERMPDAMGRLVAPMQPALGRPPERAGILGVLGKIPGGSALWRRIRTNKSLRARHALLRWRACSASLESVLPLCGPTPLLMLPYLDDMLEPGLDSRAIAEWVPLPWFGLYIEASELRDERLAPAVVAKLPHFASPGCRGIMVFDPVAGELLRKGIPPGLPVETIPDIGDLSLPARAPELCGELVRRAAGRKIVSLMGHLSEAKNIGIYLKIATAPCNRDLFFLLAGQYEELSVSPETRRLIKAAAQGAWENVMAVPRRIENEADFNALFVQSDVAFAVYRRFTRSSGMLFKAGYFRKPIVVAEGFCMAEQALRFGLGRTAGEESLESCQSAVRSLVGEGAAGARYEEFVREVSLPEFNRKVAEVIRACMERPGSPTPGAGPGPGR